MKRFNLLLVAAVMATLFVPAAFAQLGTVKGSVKGMDGKPMAGAVVTLSDKDTGHKYELKADKSGNIFSLGVAMGTYDITVNFNGQQVWNINGYKVSPGDSNPPIEINLQQEAAKQQQSLTPEQKKQQEAASNERQKIKNLNEMLAQSKAASDAGNYDQAVQILTQATQLDPTRELLWFKLADAQRNQASKATDDATKKTALQAAVDSYNKALQLAPNTKPDVIGATYNNMAEAYAKLGDTDKAIKSYDQAAAADITKAGQYYFNEGAVLTNTNHYKEANEAFDKAIQADPTKADAYYWKGSNGVNMATMKDNKMVAPPGTEEAFNKYLELEPTGKYADQAKAMLQALGASIETNYGKGKAPKKK